MKEYKEASERCGVSEILQTSGDEGCRAGQRLGGTEKGWAMARRDRSGWERVE